MNILYIFMRWAYEKWSRMAGKQPQWPPLPWKIRILIFINTILLNLCIRRNGTVNRWLFNLIDVKSPPSETPVDGVASSDVTINPSKNLWARIYAPSTTTSSSVPLILFFHGGGFAIQSVNSKPYDKFCRRLARELPAVIVSVNYRLSPEDKYPNQYEDGIEALKFLDSEVEGFPSVGDRSRCFIAGDSSGGNIAHHVVVRGNEIEFERIKVSGLVSIQPFFGGEERVGSEIRLAKAPILNVKVTDGMWKAFLPLSLNRDHPAVNVTGPNSDEKWVLNYPDTVLFVGGFDPLQDWQKRYHQALKKGGKQIQMIEYPNAIHGFYAFPELPEASLIITAIKEFLLHKHSST